jgi:hypothetical protein
VIEDLLRRHHDRWVSKAGLASRGESEIEVDHVT